MEHARADPSTMAEHVTVTIYGLMGHAGKLQLPLEELDVESLEPGEEFPYQGRIYEIRSVTRTGNEVFINVMLAVNSPIG